MSAFFMGGTVLKVTVNTLKEMKANGEKITMLTAYDYQFARILDAAGADTLLVGDSLGNVMLGYANTLPVTMDEMIHHTKAVARAAKRAFVIFDMPFMSYQVCVEDAVFNAGRAVKETGAECVKLEGGGPLAAEVTAAIVECGIPVCAHLGLTPQSVNAMGGFVVQGKALAKAKEILDHALMLQAAGACMVVLEAVPWKLAQILTEKLDIPTIGIGAGPHCDGQVLVVHDMFNMSGRVPPKFAKVFEDAEKIMTRGARNYVKEVKAGTFPETSHSFAIDDAVIAKLKPASRKKAARK
jgi:3-methyl-2-oxobutanoate hydroxymethyltransferase